MTSLHSPGDEPPIQKQMRTTKPTDFAISRVAVAKWIYWSRRMRPDAGIGDLYGEAVWDMLLDLYIHVQSGKKISVSSLCIGSHVPVTTAIRYIAIMEERGWFVREEDEADKRRNFLQLSSLGKESIETYLDMMLERLRDLFTDAFGNSDHSLVQMAESIEEIKRELFRRRDGEHE